MCFDYMNGNICKHLHRIHSMQVSIEEMGLDVPDVDHMSTDNTEEVIETSNDLVIPYSFPCISASSTCKKLVYGSYNIIVRTHTHTHARARTHTHTHIHTHTHACTHVYTHIFNAIVAMVIMECHCGLLYLQHVKII